MLRVKRLPVDHAGQTWDARRRRRRGDSGVVGRAAAYFLLHRAPHLTDRDTIVLADFTNTTGDPVFDETLRQGLAVQLQQSPFLSLVSEERIRKELTLMQRPPDARLTSQLAQDVCVRTASAAVLDGSIASLGTQYVIALRARNCSSGDILADEPAQAVRKEEVLGALSQIAIRFRTRTGESLATIEKHSMPLEEATTSSLEAWKAFSTASRAYQSGDASAALPLFKRAVAIDPNFAIAYARLGIHYSNVGEWTLARENTLKAYRLRDRASQVEQFLINTFYDRQVTGNLERQQQTMESWARTYPRDPTPLGLLAGTATVSTGKYELSIAAADRSLAIEPDLGPTYNSKANSQLSLNRLADAEDTIRRAAERNLEFTNFLLVRYFIAFLNGDSEDMKRKAALAREKLATQDMISHIEALVLARSGRLQEARQRSAVAVDIAQKAGQRERAALFDAATAVWEAFYGHPVAARQKMTTALDLARGRDLDYAAAFALAVSGDVTRSRALTDELARDYADDTSVQYIYLPTLRALFSLNAHDAAASIQTLQTASRFDLGMGGIGITGYFGRLYPIYVRGLAYLAAQQPAAAAAEFRRIIDHRSIVLVDPMDAMARLQLARALVLSGDTAKAKSMAGRTISAQLATLVFVHGAAMTAWLMLFLVQSLLVPARKLRIHMKLGDVDTLAEQHETNPRSVWGYVQGLTRLSQRTPWQDGVAAKNPERVAVNDVRALSGYASFRDFRPRLTGPDGPKLSSVAGCTAPGGTRLTARASGAESVATATVAARDRGPLALGVVVEVVDLLEHRTRHRQTGNRRRLASQGLPRVLDVEKSPPRRSTGRRGRCPRVDSEHLRGQPALGRAADSRRVAEIGPRRVSSDRREVHAPAHHTAVADVAHVPDEPRPANRGGRFLRRADRHRPTPVRAADPRP
jgi:eukaryotic-like serine/threonine-protein kinase